MQPPITFVALMLTAAPLEVEPEELRPGLVAVYRSVQDPKATVLRIDAKPAFTLGDSSPHPRVAPGPFDVTWTGAILLREPGPVRFRALTAGKVRLEIDGVEVLHDSGKTPSSEVVGTAALERRPGLYPLRLRYSSSDLAARLQLCWEGEAFAREPIPAWRFKHVVSQLPEGADDEALAEAGKRRAAALGCARCHQGAFPGLAEPPPGPSLDSLRVRVDRDWLLRWLADPRKVHADARMPALFTDDAAGHAERWLIANHLAPEKPAPAKPPGDHREGRKTFLSIGCVACHHAPEEPAASQADLGRTPLRGLGDRFTPDALAGFLAEPHGRYPDGRMPRLPLSPKQTADIGAYLLLWSPASARADVKAPDPANVAAVRTRLNAKDDAAAATALLREKRCVHCHAGLGDPPAEDVPVKRWDAGCLAGATLPRFTLSAEDRKALNAYARVAPREVHPSPFAARQRQLERAGCVRCHQRDTDRPPALEAASSTIGGAYLQAVPFQRTPRLTYPHQQFEREHLLKAVRDGVSGVRSAQYTFRMPAFGKDAEQLVRALAEADGELPEEKPAPALGPDDPTLAPQAGPPLVGFQGYSCVSCHVWQGQRLSEADPANVGTDLTRVHGRIRRSWFARFLEDPARFHPGTPMPAIFPRGKPAALASVLDGDVLKQREALWHYFALGPDAPSPKPPPPLAALVPPDGPLVGQIPIHVAAKGGPLESMTVLNARGDLFVYDLGARAVTHVYVGGQVLRHARGRLRKYSAEGTPVPLSDEPGPRWHLVGGADAEEPTSHELAGYDRLSDGVRLRWSVRFPSANIEIAESLRIPDDKRALLHEMTTRGLPPGRELSLRSLGQSLRGRETLTAALDLPAATKPPAPDRVTFVDPGRDEGSLERPGYRATPFPRPKTASGEDRVMPGGVAVHPRDGRVFVASMKLGELFVVNDPDKGKDAHFDDLAGGLFQECYSLLAEEDGLYVLHRRNLSRVPYPERGKPATRIDRVARLAHGVGDTYDYAYGLARNKAGDFVLGFAPYANRTIPGSGGAISLKPGQLPREVAWGMRNPVGWCAGNDGEAFFTDNQGEWVATNKLVHVNPGRYFGFPNSAQKQHAEKPRGKTSLWVPYAWARSINGVTYDNTGGKFGPFAGQFFLAELMYGGAIIRAQLEKVNGEYQGACWPFWGRGLLGPVTLAFDPSRGPLYVGGITEPGWMAQPDRGAFFRIDYTGELPFEMQSVHVRPRGFRITLTRPADPATLRDVASYRLEHYRYEYTGAYGSPELDRTPVSVDRVEVSPDGRSVELTTAPLVRDRVYMIAAPGVRDPAGVPLVHPTAAYTLNETPER